MPRNHPILLRYEITDGEGYLKELMAIHGSGMMMCLTGNSTQSDDGLPHSFLLGVMVVDVLTIFVGEMLRSSGLTNSPKSTRAIPKRLVNECLRRRMSLVVRSFQGPPQLSTMDIIQCHSTYCVFCTKGHTFAEHGGLIPPFFPSPGTSAPSFSCS